MNRGSETSIFFAAKCPSCGGDLQLPTNITNVKCMYCQSEIIIFKNENGNFVSNLDKEKLEKLIVEAFNSKNYSETIDYANKILELNDRPLSLFSMYYKGICVGHLSTADNFLLDEMLHLVQKSIDETSPFLSPETIETLVMPMVEIILFEFTLPLHDKWTQTSNGYKDSKLLDIQLSTKSFGEQLVLANGVGNSIRNFYNNQSNIFLTKFFPTILEIANYSWKMAETEQIADRIVKLYLFLVNCEVHLVNSELINSSMKPIMAEIRLKYPTLETQIKNEFFPNMEKEKKDCFVVTATMEDINHPYVITLRRFRDLYLRKSIIGNIFIRVYNTIGPILARFISQHPWTKVISRNLIIEPMFLLASKMLDQRLDS